MAAETPREWLLIENVRIRRTNILSFIDSVGWHWYNDVKISCETAKNYWRYL